MRQSSGVGKRTAQIGFTSIIGHPTRAEFCDKTIGQAMHCTARIPRRTYEQLMCNEGAFHTLVIQPIAIVAIHFINGVCFGKALEPCVLGPNHTQQSRRLLQEMPLHATSFRVGNGIVGNVGMHRQLRKVILQPTSTSSVRSQLHMMTFRQQSPDEWHATCGVSKAPIERGDQYVLLLNNDAQT